MPLSYGEHRLRSSAKLQTARLLARVRRKPLGATQGDCRIPAEGMVVVPVCGMNGPL